MSKNKYLTVHIHSELVLPNNFKKKSYVSRGNCQSSGKGNSSLTCHSENVRPVNLEPSTPKFSDSLIPCIVSLSIHTPHLGPACVIGEDIGEVS